MLHCETQICRHFCGVVFRETSLTSKEVKTKPKKNDSQSILNSRNQLEQE